MALMIKKPIYEYGEKETSSIVRSIIDEVHDLVSDNLYYYESRIDRINDLIVELLIQTGASMEEEYEELTSVPSRPCWLYFIKNEGNGNIKIGISQNVKARIKDLQVACGDALSILSTIEYPSKSDALMAEQALHQFFKSSRRIPKGRTTEWFSSDIEKYLKGITREAVDLIIAQNDKNEAKLREQLMAVKFF